MAVEAPHSVAALHSPPRIPLLGARFHPLFSEIIQGVHVNLPIWPTGILSYGEGRLAHTPHRAGWASGGRAAGADPGAPTGGQAEVLTTGCQRSSRPPRPPSRRATPCRHLQGGPLPGPGRPQAQVSAGLWSSESHSTALKGTLINPAGERAPSPAGGAGEINTHRLQDLSA